MASDSIPNAQIIAAPSISEDERSKLEKDTCLPEFKQNKLENDAKRNWDIFYKRNTTKFFKDRHWTMREFKELSGSSTTDKLHMLEVGCGVGNFLFPLLEGNPNLTISACDFSPRAVDFVRANKLYEEDRCNAFQCDLTVDNLTDNVAPESVDIVSMIFVLSAIHPDKMDAVLRNTFSVLKPGGCLLFRDYGLYDHAMLRFAPGHKLSENFYVRQDGTRAYYFELDMLKKLFSDAGYLTEKCDYISRETVNKKEGIQASRVFVQGKFTKPVSEKSLSESYCDLMDWMADKDYNRKSLSVAIFPETGRGLKTKETINKGEVIIAAPFSVLITTQFILNHHRLGHLLKSSQVLLAPSDILSLFLIWELNLGHLAPWQPYIASLPKSYNNAPFWSEEEIAHLPRQTQKEMIRVKDAMNASWERSSKFLCSLNDKEHLQNDLDFNSYCWAWSSVNTRCVYMEQPNNGHVDCQKEKDNIALVPFFDLLNHSNDVKVKAGFNQQTKCYEVRADKTFEPGDQVFIYYGDHDNSRLLAEYGFCLPSNPNNIIPVDFDDLIKLSAQLGHVMNEEKLNIILSNQFNRGILASYEGLSWNFETLCKIIVLSDDDVTKWHNIYEGCDISPRNAQDSLKLTQEWLLMISKQSTLMDKFPEADNTRQEQASQLHKEIQDIITYNLDLITLT